MEETSTLETPPAKSMMPMVGIGLAALVILAGGAWAWSKNTGTPAAKTDTTTSNVQGVADTAPTDSSVKTVDIEAGSFYYKPNEIHVKKGEKVKIVMHSVSMMHDFNIDELNVKMPITKNGDTGTVEFTADKVGTFEYYCSVGQHRAHGQVGKITIE